jgi:squalene synthase HpnC
MPCRLAGPLWARHCILLGVRGAMTQLSLAAELSRFGPEARRTSRPSPGEAAEYCRRLARSHYENFTVASWLLPRRLRPHFHAIYAYCRWADDLADEPAAGDDRLALLDWWENELDRCYAGEAEHPVFVALSATIREFAIPREPFARLLAAFRQDQHVKRYETHDDVLGYCRNSANPVGRLVLHLARCHDLERGELADSICTGLQLANFCQDVARDWDQGRLYLPQATLARHGYTAKMFAGREFNEPFRRALRDEVDRAQSYLERGQPLVGLVPRELRVDVALFAAGGLCVLRAVRDLDYNVWNQRPVLSKARQLRLLAGCWWRSMRL